MMMPRRAGREDGGACADQHLRVAGAHCQPLFEAGAVGQRRVMHGDALAQARGETGGEGADEADFRYEQQYLPAIGGEAFYPADVDFRFAGAGNAIEQGGGEAAVGQGGEGGSLFGVQRRRGGGGGVKSVPMGACFQPAAFFEVA